LVAADPLSLRRPAARPAAGPAGWTGVGGRVRVSLARETAAGGGGGPAGARPAWSGPVRARPAGPRSRGLEPRRRPAPVLRGAQARSADGAAAPALRRPADDPDGRSLRGAAHRRDRAAGQRRVGR